MISVHHVHHIINHSLWHNLHHCHHVAFWLFFWALPPFFHEPHWVAVWLIWWAHESGIFLHVLEAWLVVRADCNFNILHELLVWEARWVRFIWAFSPD
jgi:hypothetical protein